MTHSYQAPLNTTIMGGGGADVGVNGTIRHLSADSERNGLAPRRKPGIPSQDFLFVTRKPLALV